jgi:hypothetical protein
MQNTNKLNLKNYMKGEKYEYCYTKYCRDIKEIPKSKTIQLLKTIW